MQRYYEGSSELRDVKAIVAAINDEYGLKSRETIDLLYDWLSSDEDKELRSLVASLDRIVDKDIHDSQETAHQVLDRLNEADLKSYMEYLDEIYNNDIKFLPFYSVLYPQALWKISNPPLGVYIRGSLTDLFGGIAIVGTRDATEHRREFARELASELAGEGHTIVSGLANGIDEMAHRGAIQAGGNTIAILPGGIQTIRPASNRGLAEEVTEHGALLGESSDKIDIHRGRFVQRNRITSGLSIAVIVVASNNSGGTVRQAEFAEAQSRPRFMYDPDANDGQAPDELARMGLQRFQTIDELPNMLDSNWNNLDNSGPLEYFSE